MENSISAQNRKWLESLELDLELRGHSESNRDQYPRSVRRLLSYYDKPADELDAEDIRQFLHYLHKNQGLSTQTVNVYNSAIRFFYRVTLDRDWDEKRIPRYKDVRSLPVVLTREEISLLLDHAVNLKYRCLFMLIYGSGLRLREAASLRVADIDSRKMQIRINKGRGAKDRFAILPKTALTWLREYWRAYRPKEWLFEGQNAEAPLSGKTIQISFKRMLKRAGIDKPATVHTLRHSFATHLLEAGVDVFSIKKMMGHADIKSTMVYLHVANITSLNVQSPLDTPHD